MTTIQHLKRILFLDIETISITESFNELDERLKNQWTRKAAYIDPESDATASFFEKAGIYAEFGKIINISFGSFYHNDEGELCLKIKSFTNKDEKALLQQFVELINKFDQRRLTLCAHNGKEFDFPFLCRRMLINGIPIPQVLKLSGKKPWEVNHLDTLELWKFGDKKNYTSLELLAALFNIPTSKDNFDGSMVNSTFYTEGNLKKIKEYCEKDVAVTAQLFLKYNNLELPKPENIVHLS